MRALSAAVTAAEQAPAAAATQSKPLGVNPLGPAFEGWQGTMLEVNYPPGVVSASHQHPGPTFGYVVSGKIRWAINGEPAKILEAGQTFFEPCPAPPSELFRRLRERNPAPYGFLLNLGAAEWLVGASPEMYVRVDGRRVETCPIAGTIAR